MSNELLVRIAGDKDVPTLAQFNLTLAWQTEQKRLELPVVTRGLRILLKHPNHGFYTVAEAAGEVVGCVMVTYEWSDWRCGLFWWIQSVYVKPEFRRQKVFSRLFEFLKEKASQESNVCGFRVYVEGANHTAQSTYSRVGMGETTYKVYEELFER
ncbi:MAG TPA: GNAT family N-acetyltransferase [Sedimentisphaerales bacterium]|nr:GNAT family N-acetyltransferase [Sedimentisphaerales bacterium]